MKPKHDNGKPDTRYTVTLEHTGHHQAQYVARFLAERIGAGSTPREAWALACDHQRARAWRSTTWPLACTPELHTGDAQCADPI